MDQPQQTAKKTRMIIDTDPGIDDAVAIVVALSTPHISLEGLTVVHGNSTDIQKLGRNACTIVELLIKDTPVYLGAAFPLKQTGNKGAEHVHGNNLLGEVEFPHPAHQPHPHLHAVDFLIEKVKQYPGEIEVVAIGPLTNIALALLRFPDFPKLVKKLVIMGGAVFVPGNANYTTEYNILSDVHAAKIVFNAPWTLPITLASLDITNKVAMCEEYIHSLDVNKTSHFLSRMLLFCRNACNSLSGLYDDDVSVHDVTAVFYVTHPHLFTQTRLLYVDVEDEGRVSRGMTVPILGEEKKQPNVMLLQDANIPEMLAIFKQIVTSLQ
eukprot:TRINITY_DN5155_c0_g1_i1.p1 TRINITY_DN5155_c0_g1~~TRINITY_DN5155_c0_g1_i1.p1  ORF type:complete len:324 (-),score=72.25 TRINITY_DN5155_c0_g1_i1:27-998(-)